MSRKSGTKPVLIQVIDDLGAGGAERLLVGLLPDLVQHYTVVLVTLNDKTEFPESALQYDYRYSLQFGGIRKLPSAVKKMKAIIRQHEPVLVASHLYWSTIISRRACSKSIPLVFTVHQMLSDGAFHFNKKGIFLKWLDKFTYKKRHTMIGVSEEVIRDYDREIGLSGKTYVLHNYVTDEYFNSVDFKLSEEKDFKLVAVGNPKWEKNFEGLIRALAGIKMNIHCDIYGYNSYNKNLQDLVDELKAPVTLKGRSEHIAEKLKTYDAFVMSSFSEGFGIAAAEAMAIGLPLLLSDLKVLREITHGNAIFFDPRNEQDLKEKLTGMAGGQYDLAGLSEKGKKIATNYSKSVYLKKLLGIYNEVISSN